MIRCQPTPWWRDAARVDCHQTTSEPTSETTLELGVVLEMTLPAVPTAEPAATPHQRGTPAAHLQVTDPLRSPVPHPITAEPAMGTPLPPPGRFNLHLEAVNRIDQHAPHPNT